MAISLFLVVKYMGCLISRAGDRNCSPKLTQLLAKDVSPEMVIPILDRYVIFYIRTADKLQRTARWIENLPGGINHLREIIPEDKLGICSDMERQMEELVASYFCEWTETVRDPERRKVFRQFANTDETVENVKVVQERWQQRPANWAKESAKVDFKGHQRFSLSWKPIVKAVHFRTEPVQVSSANVKHRDTQLAVFKIKGAYSMCPHKRAFVLSDGLVGDDDAGKYWVSWPNHKRNFELNGDQAGRCSNDEEVNIATFPVEERSDGWIYLKLPPMEELDSVLGTQVEGEKRGGP